MKLNWLLGLGARSGGAPGSLLTRCLRGGAKSGAQKGPKTRVLIFGRTAAAPRGANFCDPVPISRVPKKIGTRFFARFRGRKKLAPAQKQKNGPGALTGQLFDHFGSGRQKNTKLVVPALGRVVQKIWESGLTAPVGCPRKWRQHC